MIIKINIILFLFIIKNISNIILEYKRDYYKGKNNTFHFTEYFNNYISTKLCFGSNNQCLKLNIELNSFPLLLITSKSKSSNINQISFDQFSSETFYLKDTSTHVYYHSKYIWTYYCYDILSFQNYNIQDFFFLGVEIFEKNPINSGIIGFDFQNREKSFIPENNFLTQLKKNKIINNYSFSFIYNKYNDNKREEGNLLIGELPNKYLIQLENKNLIYKNVIEVIDELKWGIEIEKVYVGNNIIENKTKIGFSIEHGIIIGSFEYKEYILNNFFNDLFQKEICYSERFEDLFQGFVCNENLNYDNFENITFKIGKKEFTFSKNDLFIKNDRNKILFLIVFPSKDFYFTKIDWTFGVPFFKKYIVVFDMDKKIVGYYLNIELANYEQYENTFYFLKNVSICLFIIIIILVIILYFYSKNKPSKNINDELYEKINNIESKKIKKVKK